MSNIIIPDAYQITYGKNFEHNAQQKLSRMKMYSRVKHGCVGDVQTHNRYEEEEFTETTGQRMAATQISEVAGEIRNLFPRKFQSNKGQDQFDQNLLASTVLPGSTIMEAQTFAFNRLCDDVFIDGITGVNRVGAVGGQADETLAAENMIPIDFVRTGAATPSNMTSAKLRYAKRLFEQNEFYGQDQKAMGAKLCCAMSSAMKDAIIADPLISDADRSAINKLDDGDITYWNGIHFIRTERLPVDADNPNIMNAVVWVSNCVQFDEWAHSVKRISERPDRSYAIQYYCEKIIGACRLEQEAVATIACQTDLLND